MQFSGDVSSVSGRCPTLTLTVNNRTVNTDSGTIWKRMDCGDMKVRRQVEVIGVADSSGAVRATQITRIKDDN